ncbi:leucine-rich repeat-containing protein 74B-like [Haliotis rubra]|uniref:leucine-rich repeat-containing protein 74B-like n=1 Tax=Haliotis rubra TaxID=36100 RepID=UPI001EE56BE4|nr:leucine-rich repeat-containing protein 74B-like [Haliotis rubra]
MSVQVLTDSGVSSAAKSVTICCGSPDEDDRMTNTTYFSEEGPFDSSDEYDTDLDLPLHARSPPPETPDEDKLDVICRKVYRRACSRQTPAKTYPQRRIDDGLAERTMHLKYRTLGCNATRPLSVALTNNLRVERLDLQYADMKTEGVKDLAMALSDNITVSYLNLGNNDIGTDGTKWIAYLLLKNKLIKHLNIEGNKLTDNAAPHLAMVLEHNTSLSILDLSHNEFCDNGAKLLAAALGLNTGLETFRISWNHVRGKGAVAMCQSLKYNETLKLFDVSMNGFGYEGSVAMAEALKVNTTLRELDMSSNRITWNGALIMSRGLKDNVGLEILRLGKNPLSTTGCMDITEAITYPDSKVKFLDLTGVSIIAENEVLADAVRMRKGFRFLHGGIVMTPDKFGERKARKKSHMEVLMEYMRKTCIRPMEIIRDYDKSVNFEVAQDNFVDRLVRANVPLHKFEMRALARAITENESSENKDKIDYVKLIESVTEQILEDRIRIKSEKRKIRKTKQHHKRILASGLPEVLYDRGNGTDSKQRTSRTSGSSSMSAINFSQLNLGTMSYTSLPSVPDVNKNIQSLESSLIFGPKKTVNTSAPKPKAISMCADLGDQGKKKKKKKSKSVRKKKSKSKTHVETWISKSN